MRDKSGIPLLPLKAALTRRATADKPFPASVRPNGKSQESHSPILKSDNETDILGEQVGWEEELIGGEIYR